MAFTPEEEAGLRAMLKEQQERIKLKVTRETNAALNTTQEQAWRTASAELENTLK